MLLFLIHRSHVHLIYRKGVRVVKHVLWPRHRENTI